MKLVRISYREGQPPGFGLRVSEVVYRTMVDVINVPPHDNFQVISEHASDGLIYDTDDLGIARTDGVVFIQITLNEGRTVEMKKAFYRALAMRLSQELGIRPEDVFVNLVEEKKKNWSFGNRIAQYAD